MAAFVLNRARSWEWRRVGAWSSSFAAHLVGIALLAAPWAASRTERVAPPEPTLVTLREPPPLALPEPPPPVPPPLVRRPKPAQPVRSVEATPVPIAAPAPVSVSAPPALPQTHGTDALVETAVSAPSGVAQKLAYDGVLRPPYPTASVRAHEQGVVVLRVLVGADGRVQQVEIERSSGHARLDAAARETVLEGRFHPVMQDGKAMAAWGLVPIEFRLDRL